MHNEAGVSCLPLHSVQGALLLGEQGYLRSRHLHGSVGHGTSEVPSTSLRLDGEHSRQVHICGWRSFSGSCLKKAVVATMDTDVNAPGHVMENNASMISDGLPVFDRRLSRMRLQSYHFTSGATNILWRQHGFIEDHLHAYPHRQHAGQLRGVPDVGFCAHVIIVFLREARCWRVHRWNVIEYLPSSVRIQASVGMHGVRHDAPLIRGLIPVSCIFEARVRRTIAVYQARLDNFLPALLRDWFPSGRAHGFQHFYLPLVGEALHLDKVDDIFHVSEELASLLMLVRLTCSGCEE